MDNNNQNTNQNVNTNQTNTTDQPKSEAESGRLLGILSYIGILCLIPYFTEKNNSFVVFHAKQGLNLFIFEIICYVGIQVVARIIPMLGFLTKLIELGILVFSVIGIVYVCQSEKKELPLISEIKFIK